MLQRISSCAARQNQINTKCVAREMRDKKLKPFFDKINNF